MKTIFALFFILLLMTSCTDKENANANLISPKQDLPRAKTNTKLDDKQKARLAQIHKKAPIRKGDEVFIQSYSIRSYDKPLLIVFGSQKCPYCDLLKDDIAKDKELTSKLKQLSAYYINVEDPSPMEIEHRNEIVPANAVVLKDIYQITNVPSFVFKDANGTQLLSVPGYMKKEVFHAVLDFVNTGAFKNTSIKKYFQDRKLTK